MKYLFSNTTKWIWITGVAGIIILPLIFKIPFSSFCSNYFDYTQTGQIGDTIGGITGPFINLLAAVLVYLAFKAQIDANKLNEEQHSFNYLVDQINRLEDIVLNSSINVTSINTKLQSDVTRTKKVDYEAKEKEIQIDTELSGFLIEKEHIYKYSVNSNDLAKISTLLISSYLILCQFEKIESNEEKLEKLEIYKSPYTKFVSIYLCFHKLGLKRIISKLKELEPHNSKTKKREQDILLYNNKNVKKMKKLSSIFKGLT